MVGKLKNNSCYHSLPLHCLPVVYIVNCVYTVVYIACLLCIGEALLVMTVLHVILTITFGCVTGKMVDLHIVDYILGLYLSLADCLGCLMVRHPPHWQTIHGSVISAMQEMVSGGYPARRLTFYGQSLDWLARWCQCVVSGWDSKFDMQCNSNNINDTERSILRFCSIWLCLELSPARTLEWNHVQCQALSTYSMLCATWYDEAAHLLDLMELKSLYLIHMSIISIYVMIHVHLANWLAILHGKNFNIRYYTQTVLRKNVHTFHVMGTIDF